MLGLGKTFRHLDERDGSMTVSDEGCLCNNKTSQSWENKKQNNQMTAGRVITDVYSTWYLVSCHLPPLTLGHQ